MKLLVSVRNGSEARAAVRGGVDILDIKEPDRGSLGAAPLETIQEITRDYAAELPVSVAAGELNQFDGCLWDQLPTRCAFVKLGLAGCQSTEQWPQLLRDAWSRLPPSIGRVAVAYADWQECEAPPPEEVVAATAAQANVFLLDTHEKTASICDRSFTHQVGRWVKRARSYRLPVVIAGSLSLGDLAEVVAQWSPDVIAVRGAACTGDRASEISQEKVEELTSMVRQLVAPAQVGARRTRSPYGPLFGN